MIKIGHSSIAENNKATGGQPGDQTGREVCIRTWYSSSWDYVLRPKKSNLAQKSAKFVEDVCENNMVGYDQGGRNSLYKEAKIVNFDGSKIKNKCESDCSTFMHVAGIAGGANLSYGSNGFTTRTMVDEFRQSGDYDILSDKKYLTSDKYLRRGDILVNVGSHTVMVLEDGELAYTNKVEDKFIPYLATTTSDLNLRSTPSSTYKDNIITVMPKGTYVSVIDFSTGVWMKVQVIVSCKQYIGYASSKYLSQVDISKKEIRKVSIFNLNVRAGQNTLYPKIFTMKKSDIFTVIKKDKWGLIFYNNKLGYANVSNAYSKKI